MKRLTIRLDALARVLFVLSLPALAFVFGVVASERNLFPVPFMKRIPDTISDILVWSGIKLPWYYQETTANGIIGTHRVNRVSPNLRLISGLGDAETTVARVVDAHGRVIHSWLIEWQRIWPVPAHLPSRNVPRGNRALVHGMALAPNGDLIFNFDERGMVRLDPCGAVRWRLPHRTHHSIEFDDSGNIWAPGQITRETPSPRLPNYSAPFEDFTILTVSPEGRVLRELLVADLLIANGLTGLLYMANTSNFTMVGGDTLHLNDVEVFPAALPRGVFGAGDVMISLRNINAIIVFDAASWKVKYRNVGGVLRQHDPDFVDGNTLLIFDNNNLSAPLSGVFERLRRTRVDPAGHYSRIVRLSALTGQTEVQFSGSTGQPFFTHIMGRQQLLPNGNILLTEAAAGRVLEVDASGHVVWEYFNLVGHGRVGVVNDALVLPNAMDAGFFEAAASACAQPSQH